MAKPATSSRKAAIIDAAVDQQLGLREELEEMTKLELLALWDDSDKKGDE